MIRKQLITHARNCSRSSRYGRSGRLSWVVGKMSVVRSVRSIREVRAVPVREFATRLDEQEYEIDLISMKKTPREASHGVQPDRVVAQENIDMDKPTSKAPSGKPESKPVDECTATASFSHLFIENLSDVIPKYDALLLDIDAIHQKIVDHFTQSHPNFKEYLKFTQNHYKELEVFLNFITESYDRKIIQFSDLSSLEILNSLYIFKSLYSSGKVPEVTSQNIAEFDAMWSQLAVNLSDTSLPGLLTNNLLPLTNNMISLHASGINNFRNELEHLRMDFGLKKWSTLGDLSATINTFLVDFDAFLHTAADYSHLNDQELSTFLSVILQVNRYKFLKSVLDSHSTLPINYLNIVLEDNYLDGFVKEQLREKEQIAKIVDSLVPNYDFLRGAIPGFSFSNYKEFLAGATASLIQADQTKTTAVVSQQLLRSIVGLFTCGWIPTEEDKSEVLLKLNDHPLEIFDFGLGYEGNYYSTQFIKFRMYNRQAEQIPHPEKFIVPLGGTGALKAKQYGFSHKPTPFRFLEAPLSEEDLNRYMEVIEPNQARVLYQIQLQKNNYFTNADDPIATLDSLGASINSEDYAFIRGILQDFRPQGKHYGAFQVFLDEILSAHGLTWFHPIENYFLENPDLLSSLQELQWNAFEGDFKFRPGNSDIFRVVGPMRDFVYGTPQEELGNLLEGLFVSVWSPRHLQFFLSRKMDSGVQSESVSADEPVAAKVYRQIPDELELHKFEPELKILKESLGKPFAEVSSTDIQAKLDEVIWGDDDTGSLGRNKAVKLGKRLTALFAINGGYTPILDTLLHSQSVFDSFEKKVESRRQQPQEVEKPYLQIPDNMPLHEYTQELTQLKNLLGAFRDVSSEVILAKTDELASISEDLTSRIAFAKLYSNLSLLFIHNNNCTHALDDAMNGNAAFFEFERKRSSERSLIGANSKLINEFYPYILKFMDKSSLGAKVGIWSNTENEFAGILDNFKNELDAKASDYPIYLYLVQELARFNNSIEYYPNFLQHLFEIKSNDVEQRLSGADVEDIYKAFIQNLEYEQAQEIEEGQAMEAQQKEIVQKKKDEVHRRQTLENSESILHEIRKATVAAEYLAQNYKRFSDHNDGVASSAIEVPEFLGDKSRARGQMSFRSIGAKDLAEESGLISLQLAAKTVVAASSAIENASHVTEWESQVLQKASALEEALSGDSTMYELKELMADLTGITNKMLSQSVVVSMATQGAGIALGLTTVEVDKKIEREAWLRNLEVEAQKFALRAVQAAEQADDVTQKATLRALQEQEKAMLQFEELTHSKELEQSVKIQSDKETKVKVSTSGKSEKAKGKSSGSGEGVKAKETLSTVDSDGQTRTRIPVPVSDIEPSTFKISEFKGNEKPDADYTHKVSKMKFENYKPKSEQIVAEDFSELDKHFEEGQSEIRDALSIALNGKKRTSTPSEPVAEKVISKRGKFGVPRSDTGTSEDIDKISIESFLKNAKKAKELDKESKFRQAKAYEWSKAMHDSHRSLEGHNFFSTKGKTESELFPNYHRDMEYLLVTLDGQTIKSEPHAVEKNSTDDIFKLLNKLSKRETILFIKRYNKLQRKGWKLYGVRVEDSKKFLILRRRRAGIRAKIFGTIKSILATTGVILATLVAVGYWLEDPPVLTTVEWSEKPQEEVQKVEPIEVPVTESVEGLVASTPPKSFWKGLLWK